MAGAAVRRIVILGAGQAGVWTAVTLRDEGFEGELRLIGDEPHLPYERPPLSKAILAGTQSPESATLFDEAALRERRIERVVARVETIDPQARTVRLESGERLDYDQLVIATGARNRALACPGAALPGIAYLRTLEEATRLRRDLDAAAHLLVIGGGWIGLEVAATARGLGKKVTLVESAQRLCGRSLPPVASEQLAALHRAHGVDLRIGVGIERFEGQGRVAQAVLSDGSTVPCDCVLVGIGAIANDELAASAGIATAGGIVVDDFARTSCPDVFAVGDVTLQHNSYLPDRVRLETWENAQNQAIHCARAMLALETRPYDPLPWIWSDQYDVTIQILGFPPAPGDEVVVSPGPGEAEPLFAVMREGQFNGAVGFNRGREIKILRRLREGGHRITRDVLELSPNAMAKLTRQDPAMAR